MRKLGEQWIEECIDGKTHMYKVVGMSTKGLCTEMIIKDLGPVNEDGCLVCPFCGESPKIGNFGDGFSDITFYVKHNQSECVICGLMRTKSFKTKQQAIDAWNRRV